MIFSTNPGRFAKRIEFKPRSDMARLIDFVKFRGMVEGSRGSILREYENKADVS